MTRLRRDLRDEPPVLLVDNDDLRVGARLGPAPDAVPVEDA